MDQKRQKMTPGKNDVQKECQDAKMTALERKLEYMENKLKLNLNNRYPQIQGMNPPPSIPINYQYGLSLMPTFNPLYTSGVGFAPNMSASVCPSTAFTSDQPSNSSYPTNSSPHLLVSNNPYLVFTSPYPASFNNPYPTSAAHYPASSNSPYPASASTFTTSSNRVYPTSCNSSYPAPAPTSAYPSSSNTHCSASTSACPATSYPAPVSKNQPPSASPNPSMESRGYDSQFEPSNLNVRYLQTQGMNPPPGIPINYQYGLPLMPTSNPLYPSGVGFPPNMSASPYPSTAFTSGNTSNSSYPAASSPHLLVSNNPYLVITSPYPASFNNPYPASATRYPASSNSPYPASASTFTTSSNSVYLTSGNSSYPAPAPTSAYLSSSKTHCPASSSSCPATFYLAPVSKNQPPSASPYPIMGSRGYDSQFGHSVNEKNYDALNINSLPNEIIVVIFSYLKQNQLGQIARVCRRWNVLTKCPLLWKKVNVRLSPCHGCQTTVAKSFINRLPTCVTSMALNFTTYFIWFGPLDFLELCLKLKEKCPHLEELILNYSELPNSLYSVIGLCNQFLQDVKNLIFRYSQFGCDPSTDECSGISKIKILELFNCYNSSFKSPFSKMPHLKQLHLFDTNVENFWFEESFLNKLLILNLGYTDITTAHFQAIQNHGHNLKELYICRVDLREDDLTFNNLMLPHLKTICLSCTGLTCEVVVSLIQSCPSLQNVYVDESVAESFAAHPFVVANRCKLEIVKAIDEIHDHNVDYLHY